ncbi:glycosyltransferase family 4 protein [Hydrogenimonas sp.]
MKNRKIKIAFVNVMDGYSGGEIVLKRLIEGLNDEEFEKVLFTRPTRMVDSVDLSRCHIISICEQYQLKRKRGFLAIIKASRLFFSSAKYLLQMKREGIDIVHSNSLTSSIYFAFWAKLFGLRFVAHNHIVRRGAIYRILYQYINFCSKKVICVSLAVKKCWLEEGVSERKLVVIHNGVPDDFF